MALFIDGFEQFDKAADAGAEMRIAGYTVNGSLQTATGRKGGKSLALVGAQIVRSASWAGDRFVVGFAVKFQSRGALLMLTGGVKLALSATTGKPTMLDQEGYAGPAKDRWYYVEVQCDRAARQVTLFFNGKQDMTVTMPEAMAAETSMTVTLNPLDGAAPGTTTYDDFYLRDGNRLGPIQITTRFPTSDEDPNEWAAATGPSTPHWPMVGTLPVDKLDQYLISNLTGAEESFKSKTTLPDGNPILAIGMVSLVRKSTTDVLYLSHKFDGRTVDVPDVTMDWKYLYSQFSVQGDTKESIEGAEFGAILRRG